MDNEPEQGEPECLTEFSSMTAEECQIAREHEDDIRQHGAAEVSIRERDNHPNRVLIWAYTQDDLDRATDRYVTLCGND